MRSIASLMLSRRFAPHFITMFLGAFNDNFFKNAIIILITYRLAEASQLAAGVLVTIASGLLILPFLLFSSAAGQIADKYERSMLIRITKVSELVIMGAGAAAFYTESIVFLAAMIFLMGTQSAFFGPLKYSVLPELVGEERLLAANGLVEGGTFIAILLGTILGGISVLGRSGLLVSSVAVISAAMAGLAASLFIPVMRVADPTLEIRYGVVGQTISLVRDISPRREIFMPMLAVSWFYFVGAAFLSQFPILARHSFAADGSVATVFLAVFSIGIGAGSMMCAPLMRGRITTKYAPVFAVLMAISGTALWALVPDASGHGVALIGAIEWTSRVENWPVLASMFAISFFGGMYVVPLTSAIQARSGSDLIARATACLNITDSLFMTASSLFVAAALWAGIDTPSVLALISISTGVGGGYIIIRSRRTVNAG